MNIISPFNQKQKQYLGRTQASWLNVAEGGKRGSKNVLQTMAFCIALENHPNRLHLVGGVSTATARLNVLDCDGYGLLNFFEGRCREGEYQNRACLYVQSRTGEKIILISGGGKNGDEKLIKGNTYGMAYITEANECAKLFLQEVFDRTLSSKDRKVFHDLNPKAEAHWYYVDILHFHEEQQALNPAYGYNYGHFTIADNSSVTDEELVQRVATYDKKSVWYQRDILGKRKQAEGLIYPMFNESVQVVDTAPRISRMWIAVDYGHTNATAFLSLGEGVDRRLYVLNEQFHPNGDAGQKSPRRYSEDMRAFLAKEAAANPNAAFEGIIVDPSAKGFINQLDEDGMPGVSPANNDVLQGIQLVSSLMEYDLFRVLRRCTNTIRELQGYVWDEKAAQRGEDKPTKTNDHCADALRYGAMADRYYWRERVSVGRQ